ncbi:941_t:CDS:2 [Paraglomus brasilianum]|uniref:941_t:CDS:1 n=1 Tax=Paraglomus brasilianum TaxID=144538 RepID=A0A9N9AQH1_9GLOM|nr:941_t:CDS:2 [Paraglomus brasilianum]
MAGKTALVLGGTGAVGKTLVRDLLHNGGFSRITTVGRREFEYDGPNKNILVQKVIDFEKVDDFKDVFVGHDVVFCTLGTTRAQAGSASRFVEIDKGYVISSAKIIKQQNQDRDIHYLYCSTTGANKNSSFLYPRTKGEIEHELGDVGFKRVTIFRPGFLKVEEERTDRGSFEKYVVGAAIGFMKLVGSKSYVDVATVGKAMRRYAVGESSISPDAKTLENGTQFEIIDNKSILELGAEK